MRNWEVQKFGKQILKSLTTTGCSNNWLFTHSKLFRLPSSTQDLYSRIDPRLCADNAHASVLPHEMMAIEPGESPTRTLTWKSLAYLSHIKRRTNDDRFPLPLGRLGSAPAAVYQSRLQLDLLNSAHATLFNMITYGDHLQTCQTQSAALQVHDLAQPGSRLLVSLDCWLFASI